MSFQDQSAEEIAHEKSVSHLGKFFRKHVCGLQVQKDGCSICIVDSLQVDHKWTLQKTQCILPGRAITLLGSTSPLILSLTGLECATH